MTLKSAKKIFYDIVDLCQEIDDDNLSIALESLFRDADAAEDVNEVIDAARELMVFVNEVPYSDSDLDGLLSDIEELYNKLLEENEEN
jgi:allophanate hydrolase subunit 1